MANVNDFVQETSCTYKGEVYLVRDNGAVMRLTPEGKTARALDCQWTFGTKNASNGYMTIGGHRVHIIVACAFLGERDSKVYVVDHVDTNRCNNRVENLRWLTRLENILLNEFTRKKIEWICGSVESFLENPSQLRGYEHQDRNFEWMRAVKKEEAENTLRNLRKLMEKPRVKAMNAEPIGDWIYGSPNEGASRTNLEPSPVKTPEQIEAERKQEAERLKVLREHKEQERLRQETLKREREAQKREEQKARNQKKTEDRNAVKDAILAAAEANGWKVEKNAAGNGWKSDLMLDNGNCQLAVVLYKSTRKVREEQEAMNADGVKGCWLGNTYSGWHEDELYPCFDFDTDTMDVELSESRKLSVGELLSAIMADSLMVDNYLNVNKVKVRFMPDECYWCGKQHFVYMVVGLQSEEVPSLATNDGMYDSRISVDAFDHRIVDAVNRYLSEHKELNYPIGEIKMRHSKTVGKEYMSFGCPYCDGLVGSWYLHEKEMDWIYEKDDKFVHEIELDGDGVQIEFKHWIIK